MSFAVAEKNPNGTGIKKIGNTGSLRLLYFEVVSTMALIIGLVLVNLRQPGAGMNIDPATLDTKAVAACTGQKDGAHGYSALICLAKRTRRRHFVMPSGAAPHRVQPGMT
jgi:hypothetical protein